MIRGKSDFKYLGGNRCMLTINKFESEHMCIKYPRDVILRYTGLVPMLWEDDDFVYVVGLPERLLPGTLFSIENLNEKTETTFTSSSGPIDWNDFFDNFVEHKFHDDLD
jgi:hypothetical protein